MLSSHEEEQRQAFLIALLLRDPPFVEQLAVALPGDVGDLPIGLGLTKGGPGTLVLAGTANNGYSGVTQVGQGVCPGLAKR